MKNEPLSSTVIPVRASTGRVLPLLVADRPDGTSFVVPEVAAFARHIALLYPSLPAIRAIITSLALLRDHVIHVQGDKAFSPDELPEAVSRFLTDRRNGIEKENSELRWDSVSLETVKRDRRAIKLFSDFCAEKYGHFPLTPMSPSIPFSPGGAAHRSVSQRLAGPAVRNSLLAHLKAKSDSPAAVHPMGVRERPSGRRSPRQVYLPRSAVEDLIDTTPSLVQKLVFIQAAFGGQRVSEILHTWRCDVLPGGMRARLFPDDTPSDVPLVIVAHPSLARFTGTPGDTTERAKTLRSTYGLTPRHLLEADPFHLGWKEIAYDRSDLFISQVFWTDPRWAKLYAEIARRIRDEILPAAGTVAASHPYLVVNDHAGREGYGLPMKMPNILKAFRRAVERCGLDDGFYRNGIHGLRHFYKATLIKMGLPAEQIQIAMHHRSLDSQIGYGRKCSDLNERLLSLMPQGEGALT